MAKILLVEDSEETVILIQGLLSVSHTVTTCRLVEEAKQSLLTGKFDLVLIDVQLPDGNGFELCDWIRNISSLTSLAVIFLTGRGMIQDKVRGFDAGADDYLVKPFEPQELIARVESRLKRTVNSSPEIRVGPIRFDLVKQRAYADVTVDADSKSQRVLDLTPNEFRVLLTLARKKGFPVSRTDILEAVWGQDIHVQDRTVDTHIYSVRKKLADLGQLIKSVPHRGYQFETSSES